ncbi:MAG: hypothetical protein ACRD3D_13135 [Terriglobia bacterium]
MLSEILLVFAFVLTVLAAFWIPGAPPVRRVHLGWLGVACWVLSVLLSRALPR